MSTKLFQEPIHILGAGSVGMLWAASIRLSFPSYPVQLVLREGDPRRERSICLLQSRRPRLVTVPCGTPTSDRRPIRNLLLTTKAYDATNSINSVRHRLEPSTSRVFVLCNGALAVAEELHRDCKSLPMHTALTTHGVYQENVDDEDDTMYTIVNNGSGHCYLQSHEPMRSLWDSVGLDCRSTNDIETLLWKKLAANCVINPLTAIFRCRNGELPTTMDSFSSTELPAILSEVQQVYQAVTKKPHIDFLDYVDQVIKDTSQNRSSMLLDVEENRRTEIDYLNGYVVEQGARHNIDCSNNRMLWDSIRKL